LLIDQYWPEKYPFHFGKSVPKAPSLIRWEIVLPMRLTGGTSQLLKPFQLNWKQSRPQEFGHNEAELNFAHLVFELLANLSKLYGPQRRLRELKYLLATE